MSYGLGHDIDMNIITNDKAYGNVSDRYIATSTQDIIDEFSKYRGMNPVGFSSANVREKEKYGSQKHMVMLEAEDSQMIDGNLRIVLFNSHDRSTTIRMYLGYYRDACANDCVFGEDIMEPIIMKHTKKDWKYSVFQLMEQYDEVKQKTEDMIDRMMSKQLSYGDMGRYNERVADMINKDISGYIVDPSELGIGTREEDLGKNAWSMYQRVQGNVLNGGIRRVIKTELDNGSFHDVLSKTHKVTEESKKIKYNQEIHRLALEMC